MFKSRNSQSLFNISIYIYPRSISKGLESKICSYLNFSRIFWKSSEVPEISLEVPDFLRKFRTFCGSSRYSAEVLDFLRKFRTRSGSSGHFAPTTSFLKGPEVPDIVRKFRIFLSVTAYFSWRGIYTPSPSFGGVAAASTHPYFSKNTL